MRHHLRELLRVWEIHLGRAIPVLSPRTGQHEIDAPAAASRAHQPLDPVADGCRGTVFRRHGDDIGLSPVPACVALHDQPHLGSGGAAQGRRRARVTLHLAAGTARNSYRTLPGTAGAVNLISPDGSPLHFEPGAARILALFASSRQT